MNHFLPIDGLLVSYERIRPTANVALVLSKATLEQHPELMENFSLSKNGYFLTKDVIPAGLFSLAWDTVSETIAVCQPNCGISQPPHQPCQSPTSRICVSIHSSFARY